MIYFFRTPAQSVIATQVNHELTTDETNELCWLYGEAEKENEENLRFIMRGRVVPGESEILAEARKVMARSEF